MQRKLHALFLFYTQLAGFPVAISLGLCGLMAFSPTQEWGMLCFLKLLLGSLILLLYRHTYRHRFFFLYNLNLHEWEILLALLLIDFTGFLLLLYFTSFWL
ncbi:hypothetical protein [Siphonobacter sp.]|uniref:hypothetical protein n=1 Tax=Siphonobacter sp. TaxID=1869184 RepID=UPI003B3B0960